MRLLYGAIQTVTTDHLQNHRRDWFYPVYHGAPQDSLKSIYENGFKDWTKENFQERRHGFGTESRWAGVVPPVHFLGVGTYFTESLTSAKRYAYGTGRNLRPFAIRVDPERVCTINFASEKTMLKWWRENGYDPEAYPDREEATWVMTEHLKRDWDVVHFRGKSLYNLLDGNQLCVFDNRRVYLIDDSEASGFDIGAKVRRKEDGMVGVIRGKRNVKDLVERFPGAASWCRPGTEWVFDVKWRKGGVDYNVPDVDVDPVN